MKFLLLLALFTIGAVVGMAIVPLLPDAAQRGISSFHLEIKYQVGQEERPDEMADSPTPVPTAAPRPTPTLRPAVMATQANASLPTAPTVVEPSPTPTITPTPTATHTPTPTPTPTPVPPPDLRHHVYKVYMLELINEERAEAGVQPVTLGDNIAAQLHAESSLANCTSSHWGVDGLKPYMRYSLAGGYQSNGENGSGSDYCIKASDGYRTLGNVHSEVREIMEGLMSSPGHRRNILDKWHKKVNIGLAWDRYNIVGYQHFEGGYVEFDKLPGITNNILSISGHAINELKFSDKQELGLQLFYDPLPHSLTRGQVSRTYCYDSGLQIAEFRYPLTGNSYWLEDEYTRTDQSCPDPYDVSPSAPAPRSHDEAHVFWEQAYRASQVRLPLIITIPWITASQWTVAGTDFSVTVDVGGLLSKYGPGVYTILLWGIIGGEDVPIAQYSIFYEVEPPDTYNPDRWH